MFSKENKRHFLICELTLAIMRTISGTLLIFLGVYTDSIPIIIFAAIIGLLRIGSAIVILLEQYKMLKNL